jgi:hypothetical protein
MQDQATAPDIVGAGALGAAAPGGASGNREAAS